MSSHGKNKHKPSTKRNRKIESCNKDQNSDDDFKMDNGFPPSKKSKFAVDKFERNLKVEIAAVSGKVQKAKQISLKKFKCEICGKTYAMEDTLKIHIKLVHESKNQKEKISQNPISNPQNQKSRYLKLFCTGKSFCGCKRACGV